MPARRGPGSGEGGRGHGTGGQSGSDGVKQQRPTGEGKERKPCFHREDLARAAPVRQFFDFVPFGLVNAIVVAG